VLAIAVQARAKMRSAGACSIAALTPYQDNLIVISPTRATVER
jgi:hypothetical protein